MEKEILQSYVNNLINIFNIKKYSYFEIINYIDNIKKDKTNIINILNNYFKLSYEIMTLFPSLEKESKEYFLFITTLYLLRKNKDIKSLEIDFNLCFSSFLLNPKFNDAFNKIYNQSKKDFSIDSNIKNDPLLYNSINLELPRFILDNLNKTYTSSQILDLLKQIKSKSNYYYSNNNFNNHYKNINYLVETKNINSDDLIKINPIEIISYSLLNNLKINSNILHLGNIDSSYILNSLYKDKIYKLSYFFNNLNMINNLKQIIKKDKLSNIEINNNIIPFDLLKTYISYNEFDVVIYHASCLNITSSLRYISLLPILKENDINNNKNELYDNLLESSFFVKKEGLLLYYNHSLLSNESEDLIKTFLNKNNKFELVNNYNRFENNLTKYGYVALLKKIK